MTERDVLAPRELYVFNTKSGKLTKKVTGYGRGMLGMWALQNVKKSQTAVMVFEDDHTIERVYIGKDGMAAVFYNDKKDWVLGSLDNYIIDDTHLDTDTIIRHAIKY